MLNELKNILYNRKHQDYTFDIGNMVNLSTKNLHLQGIHKLKP